MMDIHLAEDRKAIAIKLLLWMEKEIKHLTWKNQKLGTSITYTFTKKIKSLLIVKRLLIVKDVLKGNKKENYSRASDNSVGGL